MKILETERIILREIAESDADFILDLLNQPSFIKYIGDRNVRTAAEAQDYIESRFIQSYRKQGFGLYAVALRKDTTPIGICGFVKRDFLPEPDIAFAFLPQFEKKGYAFESAAAVIEYGRNILNLECVLAITSLNNENSIRLLEKLGFKFESLLELPQSNEQVKLFSWSNSSNSTPFAES